jgi:hypothetical protein
VTGYDYVTRFLFLKTKNKKTAAVEVKIGAGN